MHALQLVGRACDSRSWSHDFEPHVGHRDTQRKKNKKVIN